MKLADRPSRWKLLVRRQRRKLRRIVLVLAVLAAVGSVGVAGRQAFGNVRQRLGDVTALAGLRVQDIVIEGHANTPEPLLQAAIGVTKGQPILGFSLADIRARLETIAWVQSATVSRRLPDTLVVSLVERRPFAVWQNQGKFVLIDHDGHPMPDQDIGAFGQLPLVVGAGAPAAAAALLDVLKNNYPAIQSYVVAAVRVGERRWNLHLTGGGDILLPEGFVGPALARLAELQQVHALLSRPLQVIDLRLPDRMVIRPQAADQKPPDQRSGDSRVAGVSARDTR